MTSCSFTIYEGKQHKCTWFEFESAINLLLFLFSCNDHISSETFNCWNILPLFHFTDRILVAGSGRWMSKVSGLEYHQTPDKSKKISNMRKSSFYSLYNNVLSYVVILIYIKMILYNIIYPRIFQLNYYFLKYEKCKLPTPEAQNFWQPCDAILWKSRYYIEVGDSHQLGNVIIIWWWCEIK